MYTSITKLWHPTTDIGFKVKISLICIKDPMNLCYIFMNKEERNNEHLRYNIGQL